MQVSQGQYKLQYQSQWDWNFGSSRVARIPEGRQEVIPLNFQQKLLIRLGGHSPDIRRHSMVSCQDSVHNVLFPDDISD
jgi:hypothetical protein